MPCSYHLKVWVSNTAYFNEKIYWHIWPQKLDKTQNSKKKKKIHLFRISIPVGPIGVWNLKWKYVSTQNIWPCLWNSHNSMNLVLSFPCECIFPVAKFWGFMICCRVYLCFWVKVLISWHYWSIYQTKSIVLHFSWKAMIRYCMF